MSDSVVRSPLRFSSPLGASASGVAIAAAMTVMMVAVRGAKAQTRVPSQAQSADRLITAITPERVPDPQGNLSTRVTVTLKDVSLETALVDLGKLAGVEVMFSRQAIPGTQRVSVVGVQIPLRAAIEQAIEGMPLAFRMTPDGQLLIVPADRAYRTRAAQGTVNGKVLDGKTKRPIAGATILVDDATKGVVTAEDGTFRLSVSLGEHRVTARAVGFVKQSRMITVAENASTVLEFTLQASASVLDEVVVTGTVVATERKAIPTPITVITAKELEERGITRVEELFRGQIPGVIALETGGNRYSNGVSSGTDSLGMMVTSKMFARGSAGVGSRTGTPNPLKTYVDGVEILDPSYLGTIDPKSIEKIEIITGPQAATVYGSGAMGGVMQIFTKKGTGSSAVDATLNLRYGMLENSFNNSFAPSHNHNLAVTGGTGPSFTYSGNVSYQYMGQWQPGLYNRSTGASIGATHTRDRMTFSGSFSTTAGSNGVTINDGLNLRNGRESGRFKNDGTSFFNTRRKATASSQTASLTADYRATSIWSHSATVGKSQTAFGLIPQAPGNWWPSDTLFKTSQSNGSRTSASYNTTIAPRPMGLLSTTLTLGMTGSSGANTQFTGCTPTSRANTYVPCSEYEKVTVMKTFDDNSAGAFGSWRVGFFDRLYLTYGLRAEHSSTYGKDHKIDWTPTNGAAFTMEYGELTVKLLGSYGRSTRPPLPEWLNPVVSIDPSRQPAEYVEQFGNPDLTPQYSSGPQGGIELYYGNRGSITINHYAQTISDLIQNVIVDSIYVKWPQWDSEGWSSLFQYQNVAKVRNYGWESTASLNFGPLTFRGTYTWSDSRILQVHPKAYGPGTAGLYSGLSFQGIPTHMGNLWVSYARGGTSINLNSNYVGTAPPINALENQIWFDRTYGRLMMYIDRQLLSPNPIRPAYIKSDLTASHRLAPWASLTVDIKNIGNNFGGDSQYRLVQATLGRQTLIGVSLRSPR